MTCAKCPWLRLRQPSPVRRVEQAPGATCALLLRSSTSGGVHYRLSEAQTGTVVAPKLRCVMPASTAVVWSAAWIARSSPVASIRAASWSTRRYGGRRLERRSPRRPSGATSQAQLRTAGAGRVEVAVVHLPVRDGVGRLGASSTAWLTSWSFPVGCAVVFDVSQQYSRSDQLGVGASRVTTGRGAADASRSPRGAVPPLVARPRRRGRRGQLAPRRRRLDAHSGQLGLGLC